MVRRFGTPVLIDGVNAIRLRRRKLDDIVREWFGVDVLDVVTKLSQRNVQLVKREAEIIKVWLRPTDYSSRPKHKINNLIQTEVYLFD